LGGGSSCSGGKPLEFFASKANKFEHFASRELEDLEKLE
jgi:hypothetical protein